MTVSDLKLKIFRQIDYLKEDQLEEFYGVLDNFIHENSDLDVWENVTEEQKKGILDAIKESDSGKGIPHEKVMENMRKKYKKLLYIIPFILLP